MRTGAWEGRSSRGWAACKGREHVVMGKSERHIEAEVPPEWKPQAAGGGKVRTNASVNHTASSVVITDHDESNVDQRALRLLEARSKQ